MRAKLLTISILLLLTVAIFSQTLITPIAGVEYPAIYVDPLRIENTTYVPTTTEFTVYITTNYTDASDIWGYEFTLSWNPFVLNCTDVVNGDLIVNETHPATFSKGTIDNNAGTLNRTGCLFDWDPWPPGQPINTTGGPGILANVTFKVVDWGDSDIAFGSGTFLIGGDGTLIVDIDTMPNNIGHGYFRNVADPTHDIIVTNVSPNQTEVLAPTPVGINVTVKNNGTVPERFTVKVYYDTTGHGFLIGETLVDKLAKNTSTLPLHFPWDTTYVVPGVEKGNHTIIAIAEPVVESKINPEIDKDNNRNETARVYVYSPTIAVVPESEINPDLTPGQNYTVSIYTDYSGSDIWGYEFTLSWNVSILQGINCTNGGNMLQTDEWVGDNSRTTFNTTKTPVVPGSEEVYVLGQKLSGTGTGKITITDEWFGNGTKTTFFTSATPIVPDSQEVYVNETLMIKDTNYTINYSTGNVTFMVPPEKDIPIKVVYDFSLDYTIVDATGNITFTPAPPWHVLVEVEYWYEIPLMSGANFTAGDFVDGALTLTKNNVTGLVSGPGVLATVTFNVMDIGESDITLGNETVLIGSGSFFNITMPHRLKKGHFTNQGDAMMVKVDVDQPGIEVYPTGLWTFNITVEVQNIWGAPNFDVSVYYTVGTEDYIIGTKSVAGLTKNEKRTVKFTANMSGAPPGEHEISAKVVVPKGDHDPLNDYDSSGDKVKASLLGDMDGDDYVGPIDTSSFLAAYTKSTGDPLYKAKADLVPADAPDGYIGPVDLSKFGAQYGEDER